MAKTKRSELEEVKKEKIWKIAKERHIEEELFLHKKNQNELYALNEEEDEKLYETQEKISQLRINLKSRQESEVKTLREGFNKNFTAVDIKPSKKLIELNRIMELYAEKGDYENAHNIQWEIAQLSKKEKKEYIKNYNKSCETKLKHLQHSHNHEDKVLEMKAEKIMSEFKLKRIKNFENFVLNKKREMINFKNTIKNEDKILNQALNKKTLALTQRKTLSSFYPDSKTFTNSSN